MFVKERMAGPASVAGDVFVDALPYFDQGYDAPGVREAVSILNIYFCSFCLFKTTINKCLTCWHKADS